MRLAYLVPLVALACGSGSRTTSFGERLPAADASYQRLDSTFLFELPDSGGFLINSQPMAQESILPNLKALFEHHPADLRAVMVVDNPARRADVQWIARAAMAAGGRAFDAKLSGWPASPPSAVH
jgi:hypothetical protein